MERKVEKGVRESRSDVVMPQFGKPVWNDAEMSCRECRYNDQDIDTFPCARCHVRN